MRMTEQETLDFLNSILDVKLESHDLFVVKRDFNGSFSEYSALIVCVYKDSSKTVDLLKTFIEQIASNGYDELTVNGTSKDISQSLESEIMTFDAKILL